MFKREYIDLVEKNVVDDEECEPKWLPGVIPVGLVNGANGIATGFSTSLTCHNPFDVIKWLRTKCKGGVPKEIRPWYNGFEGRMVIERKKDDQGFVIEGDDDEQIENEEGHRRSGNEISDEDDIAIIESAKGAKVRMKTYGKFTQKGEHRNGPVIQITEIPVRKWIHEYRKHLEKCVQEKGAKRSIMDFKDNSTTERPNFIIHWNKKCGQPNHANLYLTKSFGMSNMTLIDHNGFPQSFLRRKRFSKNTLKICWHTTELYARAE